MTTPHLNPLPQGERELPKVTFEGIKLRKNLLKFSGIAFGILLLVSVLVACSNIPPANSSQPAPSSPTPVSTPAPAPSPTPTEKPAEPSALSGLKTTALSITNSQNKAISLSVEIAATPEEFQTGLMYRKSLPEMQGMLFDFKLYGDSVAIPFYMKNTYIPLSIAFISGDSAIIDIQDMEPLTENLHYPRVAYRYALEVNQGWFGRYGIAVGDAVKF